VPRPQHLIDADLAQGVKRPKKHMDITLYSIWGKGCEQAARRLAPEVTTATGAAAVSIAVLKWVRLSTGLGWLSAPGGATNTK